ncbi:hypothetical protein ANN_09155 [Periplaneta americana]|uniref:Uncharacterized protein n=1 Tax=Periplaneta americana TaxID=6978 RepID=A0ABQ8TMP9_PERAM|nr:hypothetical protein ANN_09155 [Periplaneta americana]
MLRCHIAQWHDGVKRSGKALLDQYQREGNNFLGRIVAMDETWTRSYEPNLKCQSNEWNHLGSPCPKEVRPTQSAVKEMFIVAYDIDGVILHHAAPPRQTVNVDYYCRFLQHHLHPALTTLVLTCYGTKIVLQWLKEGKLVINKISQLGPMDPLTNCRWEDNIKMDLREVGYDDRDWINLAQDKDQ